MVIESPLRFPSLGMGGSISDGLGGNSPSMQDPLYTDKLGKKIKGKGIELVQKWKCATNNGRMVGCRGWFLQL
jgi:hypothetical protein